MYMYIKNHVTLNTHNKTIFSQTQIMVILIRSIPTVVHFITYPPSWNTLEVITAEFCTFWTLYLSTHLKSHGI